LNVQYSEEDYWRRVDAIKTVMLRAGEYGEFFPPALALFPYNVSIATSYAGYDDVEIAREFGYPLERIEETAHEAENHMVDASSLPANVKDADDAVLNKIVLDREHGKKFRYIKQELDFYRQYRIPLPLYHPSERLAEKRKRFGPILFSLYNRPCGKCRNVMQTSYSPERREKNIYCEQCYLEEIG